MTNPDSLSAALARQKWILLGCVMISLALAFVGTAFLPGHYEAKARVMVDPSRYTLPGLGTEAEIVRSGVLAEAVITQLGLTTDPEFSRQIVENKGGFLSLSVKVPQAVSPEIIARFQQQVSVQPVAGSYILVIGFTSNDPVKAATIATALATEYVRHQTEALTKDSAARLDASAANGDRLARLLLERKELAVRYGPKHPRMIALEADIAAVRNTDSARSLKGDSVALKSGPKLVAEAPVPTNVQRVAPLWIYGVAPFLGLMLGLLLAGVNEQLDRGFKTLRQLETMTGRAIMGAVPLGSKEGTAALVLQKPSGVTAESIRSVRAALKLIGEKEGRQIKVVTITSADEADHRALLGLWLARLASRSGEKVLLIDTNFRQPTLHTTLDRSNTPSLVDYLTGQNYLEQVIWKQDASGAHMIFGSEVPNTALDLIGSEKMKKLCGYVRQSYDLVILVAPSCLASADAAILANEADQTLFMVAARDTDRVALSKGLKLFAGFGYNALSLVMTDSKLPS